MNCITEKPETLTRLRATALSVILILTASAALAPRASATAFQIVDPVEFHTIIDTNAVLTTNATINGWLEGPVWVPAEGGYLVFSDMNANKLMKLVPPATVSVFLNPAANTKHNGNFLDEHERLVSCQSGSTGRRVVRIVDGVSETLVSSCEGLNFYGVNDLAVGLDGTIWFTDPRGFIGDAPQPGCQPGHYVYRFDPDDGNATCTPVITNGFVFPNGICLSPDNDKLYVADSDSSQANIRVFDIADDLTVSGGEVFATIPEGVPDGIRCDTEGRVWSSSGQGVYIYKPDGGLIGSIVLGRTANLCFGGPDYKTLYMVGMPYVISMPVKVAGTPALKRLNYEQAGSTLRMNWPEPSTGFSLKASMHLTPSNLWESVSMTPVVSNDYNWVAVNTTNSSQFFRLQLD